MDIIINKITDLKQRYTVELEKNKDNKLLRSLIKSKLIEIEIFINFYDRVYEEVTTFYQHITKND